MIKKESKGLTKIEDEDEHIYYVTDKQNISTNPFSVLLLDEWE